MGMIRARVSDELEQQIQERIEKAKGAIRGAEISMSTVIRYSLEKYLQEEKEEEEGVITLKFNVDNLSFSDLKRLEEVSEKLSEIFSAGYEDTIELVKNSFRLNQAIKYKLYQGNLSDAEKEKEKEILKKYSKNKEAENE